MSSIFKRITVATFVSFLIGEYKSKSGRRKRKSVA
jgi:hypothetical protein